MEPFFHAWLFQSRPLAAVVGSVTRRGYFPPKWLLLKPGGGQKLVANRHHKSGYFLATSIFWLKIMRIVTASFNFDITAMFEDIK